MSGWGRFGAQSINGLTNGPGGRLSVSRDEVGFKLKIDGEQSDLALAFQGRLQSSIDISLRNLEGAYYRAMSRVVESGKGRLRADVSGAGFHRGEALAKTWRGNVYPKSQNSLQVAGWLYTKMAVIIDAFAMGTVIKVSGNGQFLAIPLPPAKVIIRRLHRAKQTGSRSGGLGRDAWGRYTKDDNYVEQVARSLGTDLVPIIAADRQTGVLIPQYEIYLTKGKAAQVAWTKKPTPIFALTKMATLRKRLKGRALLEEISRNFPDDFVHALQGELAPMNRTDAA